jgi:hypothetical protein
MVTLEKAYNIIHQCGERAEDWEVWAETDLHNFFTMLVYTYAPGAMLRAMIAYYEEHIEVLADLLKDYDPVTGLDQFGENNKGDMLEKEQCEESLQLLIQFDEMMEKHEMNALAD